MRTSDRLPDHKKSKKALKTFQSPFSLLVTFLEYYHHLKATHSAQQRSRTEPYRRKAHCTRKIARAFVQGRGGSRFLAALATPLWPVKRREGRLYTPSLWRNNYSKVCYQDSTSRHL